MRKRTTAGVVIGGVALALIAAACGSDNKSGSGATTTAASGGATTTAAAATTTSGGGATTTAASGGATTTAAAGGDTLKVDTSKCPADATTAFPAGSTLKIGFPTALTGPAAAFGQITGGLKIQADKANANGGVGGYKVEIDAQDDAYDPNKTPAVVTQMIEQDKIAASILQIGTPNVAASQALYEQSCTPQMFVGSGFPNWGDPAHHPWTVGGILAYNTEAKTWGEFIAKKKAGAKVAELTLNNDFGKTYAKTMQQVAKDKGLTIVESKLHEATATNLDNDIAAVLAANPDVVLLETTGKFCPMAMAGLAAGGYKGITIVSATCAAVASFWKPVDPAGNGMYILGQQKDPSDPQYADDPAMKQYVADVAQYGAGADPKNGQIVTGYNVGALLIDVLTRAAKLDGGMTRANIMNAAWATNTALPLSLGGKAHVDGIKDAYPAEHFAMLQYDASKGAQVPTGDVFDVEGQTGVFQPSS